MSKITIGVRQEGTLPALDLLARTLASQPAALGGFDSLAFDHPCAGRGLVPLRFPPDQQDGVIEQEPQTVVAPKAGPAPHRRDQRKARQQHPSRREYKIATTIRRSGHLRCRPVR